MVKIKKGLVVFLSCIFAFSMFSCGIKPKADNRGFNEFKKAASTISGTDALGRVTTPGGETIDKDVGLFYFLWLGAHGNKVYDVGELSKNNPDDVFDPDSDISPKGAYHFWGEPLYGYYNSADPWVLTRHIEQFMAAEIDFLIFDTSNAVTYDNVVVEMLKLLEKFRLQGFNVPKIAFMTNAATHRVINHVYDNYYTQGAEHYYPELWYSPNGKPFILGDKLYFDSTKAEDKKILDFFEIRLAQWPSSLNDDDAFPWMSWNYPQHNHNGTMSVSVAQHTSGKMSYEDLNWGRSYSFTEYTNLEGRLDEGINFQGQWDYVFKSNREDALPDVDTVFVTGWNEWIAIKKFESGEVFYVDQFNAEYSRDIEMDSSEYGDNYFMQLVNNVRKLKYGETQRYEMPTIKPSSATDSVWDNAFRYPDFNGDAMERNFRGYDPTTTYTDKTNRNDIVNVLVGSDSKNAYFKIECAKSITEPSANDSSFMNIWLNATNSQGYNYVVNNEFGKLSQVMENGSYKVVADLNVTIQENIMTVSVPLKLMGVSKGYGFNFKVSDNVDSSDVMNFYIQGDSAPIGRLNYTYGFIKP